ncbi:MAG: hypothetical protein J0J04_07865 [Microbacterium sp.]|uniref:hypothetical protein n=1 Tax=Microbacterium sp. TaxID=51671 RepID=UPI001AD24334|nr:hypothetical protein [Microbacterium sp.]MBN9214715.1 hypothetical protein [Microbacterium sp.]
MSRLSGRRKPPAPAGSEAVGAYYGHISGAVFRVVALKPLTLKQTGTEFPQHEPIRRPT